MNEAVPVVAPAEIVMSDMVAIIGSFVPVPLVEIETVISSSATIELVAVKVNDEPAFSTIELAEVANVIVGELSFSVMVIVTDWVPSSVADPPETEDIDTTAVSSPS